MKNLVVLVEDCLLKGLLAEENLQVVILLFNNLGLQLSILVLVIQQRKEVQPKRKVVTLL